MNFPYLAELLLLISILIFLATIVIIWPSIFYKDHSDRVSLDPKSEDMEHLPEYRLALGRGKKNTKKEGFNDNLNIRHD